MNLVLIGFRGAGKSAVGHRLALRLNMGYKDFDESFERITGLTIRQFVEQFGWTRFRKIERDLISSTGSLDRHVIAAGGGAVLDKENVSELRANAHTLYLTAGVDTILKRLEKDPHCGERRPPLSDKTWEKEIEETMKQRDPWYREAADHAIDTTFLTLEEVVDAAIIWWEAQK